MTVLAKLRATASCAGSGTWMKISARWYCVLPIWDFSAVFSAAMSPGVGCSPGPRTWCSTVCQPSCVRICDTSVENGMPACAIRWRRPPAGRLLPCSMRPIASVMSVSGTATLRRSISCSCSVWLMSSCVTCGVRCESASGVGFMPLERASSLALAWTSSLVMTSPLTTAAMLALCARAWPVRRAAASAIPRRERPKICIIGR